MLSKAKINISSRVFHYTSGFDLGSYTNWAEEQPNNEDSAQYCSEMWSNGDWNDEDCSKSRQFACELRSQQGDKNF